MIEAIRYIFHYKGSIEYINGMFVLQTFLQLIALFIILHYYVRRDHMLKVVIVYFLPFLLYVDAMLFWAPKMGALLYNKFSPSWNVWRHLENNDYFFSILVLFILVLISVMLEKRLFENISNQTKTVEKVVLVVDVLINIVMLLYSMYYVFFGKNIYDGQTFNLFLYCVLSLGMQMIIKYFLMLCAVLEGVRRAPSDIETKVMDIAWCKRKIIRYLSSSYRTMGILFTVLATFLLIMTVMSIAEEEMWQNRLLVCLIYWPGMLAMLCAGVRFLIKWLFQKHQKYWKRMMSWGHEETILRMLCRELFDAKNPPQKIMLLSYTEHFIVTPLLIFRQIYYIPTYDHISYEKGEKVYNFSDGGKIKIVLGDETQTKQNQKVYIALDKALKISPMRNKSHNR